MTVDTLTPLGENGSLENETTFEAWVDNGFVDERVRYTRLNRQLYRGDTAINSLIEEAAPGISSDRMSTIISGVYAEDNTYAVPTSSENTLTTAAGNLDSIWPCIIDGARKILAVETSNDAQLYVCDVATMSVDEVVDLSSGLGAGTWSTQGVCADDNNAYVCFESAFSQYVQAYDLATWAPLAAWPTGGFGYGIGLGPGNRVRVINADDDNIAIAANNYDSSSGTPYLVQTIAKADGTLSDSGNGDSGVTTGSFELYDLCSNGDTLFFYIDGKLCSADLADLTTGCGGTGWPRTIANGGSTSCAGKRVVCVGNDTIIVADEDDANIATITTDNDRVFKNAIAGTYDGLNFWCHATIDPANAGNSMSAFVKLNVGRIVKGQTSVYSITTDIEQFVTTYGFHDNVSGYLGPCNVVFDGRDIWVGGDGSAPAALQGALCRLPLTHWR